MDAALGKVLHAFGQTPVDDCFRREGNSAILEGRLQQIPNVHTRPPADAPRNDDLEFCLYGYEFHIIVPR